MVIKIYFAQKVKYAISPVADVAHDEDLLLLHDVLELARLVDLDDAAARLLLDPVHHALGLPGAAVCDGLALSEQHQPGETLNIIFFREFLLLGDIHPG